MGDPDRMWDKREHGNDRYSHTAPATAGCLPGGPRGRRPRGDPRRNPGALAKRPSSGRGGTGPCSRPGCGGRAARKSIGGGDSRRRSQGTGSSNGRGAGRTQRASRGAVRLLAQRAGSHARPVWRDGSDRGDGSPDPVCATGEVAVLSGMGRGGKSYLATSLAIAAARADRDNNLYGRTCGLRVRAGKVVLVSFEDSPKRIDQRAVAMGGKPGDVLILPHPPPVYGRDSNTGQWCKRSAWRGLWNAVRRERPVLTIVDTGPKAMGGETTDPGAVIGFLQALEHEAREGGFAVLTTAHDTKEARKAAQSGMRIEDAVAGSVQWHDSPRGVLHLTKTGPGDADRILEAVKCSYGRDGWGARLRPRYSSEGRYAGLELAEVLDEDGIAVARSNSAQTSKSAARPRRNAPRASAKDDRPIQPGEVVKK